VELQLKVAHTIDLERFVMSYGPLVKVLGPKKLRETIKANAEAVVAKYADA